MEIVYENGIFQGYGYVTRTLETAGDQNRYVAGAEMALFEAIEVRPSGDTGDHRMGGGRDPERPEWKRSGYPGEERVCRQRFPVKKG